MTDELLIANGTIAKPNTQKLLSTIKHQYRKEALKFC
jgi:hypothetical protein